MFVYCLVVNKRLRARIIVGGFRKKNIMVTESNWTTYSERCGSAWQSGTWLLLNSVYWLLLLIGVELLPMIWNNKALLPFFNRIKAFTGNIVLQYSFCLVFYPWSNFLTRFFCYTFYIFNIRNSWIDDWIVFVCCPTWPTCCIANHSWLWSTHFFKNDVNPTAEKW